jgi:tetratricopeptide (TPR) repeat protein
MFQLFNKNLKAMKTIILIAMCLAVSAIAFAQERILDPVKQNVILPQFEGRKFELLTQGEPCGSLEDYLRGCVCYPDECIKKEIEGTEVVEFVVTPEGTLTAFNVVNSLAPEIDDHVISLLKNTSGMWTPGKINNQVVSMKKEVSVAFKYYPFSNTKPHDFISIAKKYFEKGSKQLFVKHDPRKALKYFNNGVRYLPNNESLLMHRGICRYELGDEAGARKDWERMKAMENSHYEFQQYAESLNGFKGYDELSQLINK